jgi:putative ABC transport system permease protein
LTLADAEALKEQIQGIKGVAPEVSRRYQITAKGNNTNTQVIGTVPEYLSVRNLKMGAGSFVTDRFLWSSAKVAVLGPTVRDELFGANADPVGQFVRIRGTDFEVVGVVQAKGGSGFNNPDNSVYVPLSSAQHFLSGDEYVTTIAVAAQDQQSMTAVQQQARGVLLARHRIADASQADFSILNQTDIVSTASSITGTFTTLLASIAGISLLVGGIGIMNMMLTTVTERTREIGLRKAVGIRKEYIYLQFLAEAVMLTFLGGVIGMALGWAAATLVSRLAGLTTQMSLSAVLLAFGVSAGVGIIFGLYPARRAARLKPIEALRYE